jgi:hypothetical protein
MEVRFCDLCNESVPQADLDTGRAIVSKGRVVCVKCERAMSGAAARPAAGATATVTQVAAVQTTVASAAAAPPAAEPVLEAAARPWPPPPGPATVPVAPARAAGATSTLGLWVAVLGLLFTAGAIAVFNERLKELDGSDQGLLKRLEAHAATLAKLEPLPQELKRESQRLEIALRKDQDDKADSLRAELRKVDTALQAARADLTRIAATIEALRAEATQGQTAWTQRIEDVAARLARQEDDFKAATLRLDEVEDLARNPPVAALPVGANGAGAGAAEKPADSPWKALIADLSNANSGLRWQAVDGMGQSGDPATVPYLIPMLDDGDVFVRMAAARVLGNLDVPEAIPALIDTLEDVDSPVREAALVALHQITGRDFQFDPQANEAERARRLKAVRDWWKKVEEGGGFKKEGANGR